MSRQTFWIILGVVLAVGIGVLVGTNKSQAPAPMPSAETLQYVNTDYGFSFTLPKSWAGYTVSINKWTGYAVNDQLGYVPAAQGPVVSIHNPLWTRAKPYQDIPIMVFTLNQWADLQADKFHIGAAPIGPSELGRNAKYVFALPARYNFAFPPGYEEVQMILQGKPLTAF